jgi:hypothetical protein
VVVLWLRVNKLGGSVYEEHTYHERVVQATGGPLVATQVRAGTGLG